MKKRLFEIDDIRGISILAMILVHTNVYFMRNSISYTLMEISQFAVVAFIFCSAYLFFQKKQEYSWKTFFLHLWKRAKRLVIPYWLFFAVYYVFLLLKEPHKLTGFYLLQNIFAFGGLDFNWLVLLFIQMAVLMPLVSYMAEKRKKLLIIYSALALISSLIFLKYTPLSYYRLIMWLPWSLVLIYTFYFDRMWNNKKIFFWMTLLFVGLFFATQQLILPLFRHSLYMYSNKYPPNMYHLAYGFFSVNILFLLSKLGIFSNKRVRSVIHFFSLYSYSIFFIHILVIYTLTVFFHPTFTWVTFYFAVTFVSAFIQLLLNKIQKVFIVSQH